MKKVFKTILFSVALLGLNSCDFDTENFQQIPTENAYKTVQDVQNGMNGAYYALASYRFLGNNAISYGDFCAGVSVGSASSGHYLAQSSWAVADTDPELNEMWDYGFKVIDRTTRTIKGGKDIIANAESLHLSDDDILNVKSYMAQCYAMKALSYHYLVNLFALPYKGNENSLGLPLVKDDPITEFTEIKRASVKDTYAQITGDLKSAEDLFNEIIAANPKFLLPNAFYMGPVAIQALKARVFMYLEDYTTAENAALEAIKLKGKGNGKGGDLSPSDEIYLSMWTSLAITDEDLFTLAKNEADNLSANALNTLYGSYGCTLSPDALKLYNVQKVGEETVVKDIRYTLVNRPSIGKYQGLPTSAATSNIPVLRKSEMSLILAEIYARKGDLTNAKDYLLYTAKRDKDIVSVDDLPADADGILKFISEERIREFAGEGHRFYDARRMGDKIESLNNFDIKKFVFPIPAAEINAGFCNEQNEGWFDNLPKR